MSDEDGVSSNQDLFDTVCEKEQAIEAIANRDWQDYERIGATARIVLALARGDRPDIRDLAIAGIPVGPTGDFTNQEE